jgi:hypothetical protein
VCNFIIVIDIHKSYIKRKYLIILKVLQDQLGQVRNTVESKGTSQKILRVGLMISVQDKLKGQKKSQGSRSIVGSNVGSYIE